MYIPPYFTETDPTRLQELVESNSFATVITTVDGLPVASHLPLLFEPDHGPHGRLVGHMARANPQWKQMQGRPALAVFTGPHAYISPSWAGADNLVPTWNYVALHATGEARLVDDPDELLDIVRRSVEFHEADMPTPWSLDSNEADFNQRLLGAIVGFTIDIDRIECACKLSQNHPAERREQVIEGLRETDHAPSKQIADLMDSTLKS